jgi:hypothetical protein
MSVCFELTRHLGLVILKAFFEARVDEDNIEIFFYNLSLISFLAHKNIRPLSSYGLANFYIK